MHSPGQSSSGVRCQLLCGCEASQSSGQLEREYLVLDRGSNACRKRPSFHYATQTSTPQTSRRYLLTRHLKLRGAYIESQDLRLLPITRLAALYCQQAVAIIFACCRTRLRDARDVHAAVPLGRVVSGMGQAPPLMLQVATLPQVCALGPSACHRHSMSPWALESGQFSRAPDCSFELIMVSLPRSSQPPLVTVRHMTSYHVIPLRHSERQRRRVGDLRTPAMRYTVAHPIAVKGCELRYSQAHGMQSAPPRRCWPWIADSP